MKINLDNHHLLIWASFLAVSLVASLAISCGSNCIDDGFVVTGDICDELESTNTTEPSTTPSQESTSTSGTLVENGDSGTGQNSDTYTETSSWLEESTSDELESTSTTEEETTIETDDDDDDDDSSTETESQESTMSNDETMWGSSSEQGDTSSGGQESSSSDSSSAEDSSSTDVESSTPEDSNSDSSSDSSSEDDTRSGCEDSETESESEQDNQCVRQYAICRPNIDRCCEGSCKLNSNGYFTCKGRRD